MGRTRGGDARGHHGSSAECLPAADVRRSASFVSFSISTPMDPCLRDSNFNLSNQCRCQPSTFVVKQTPFSFLFSTLLPGTFSKPISIPETCKTPNRINNVVCLFVYAFLMISILNLGGLLRLLFASLYTLVPRTPRIESIPGVTEVVRNRS